MGDLSDTQGEGALGAWAATTMIVEHDPGDIAEAAQLVRRPIPKLLMPDAIHLVTCRRLGHRIATADGGLAVVADPLRVAFLMPE